MSVVNTMGSLRRDADLSSKYVQVSEDTQRTAQKLRHPIPAESNKSNAPSAMPAAIAIRNAVMSLHFS